ncbi:hypothetical protein [Bordetella trematum]|uniref:hypothetical protein n=1 Tax=Bordetella trematum TaxID=123899 RepID=UPI00052E90C5|nr:hypothetical protein [Bordetella trematum]
MADAGLHVARDGVRWVYGLAWFAVLGSHAAGLARRRARQMRANRYVLGGVRAVAAGCARLPWRGRLFSAAQQVALQCAPGAVAAVLPVSGRYWLVAVQDGAVQAGGDRLFTQHEEAQAALERLTSAWEVASHDPAAVEQALAAPPSPGARLRRLSPGLAGCLLLVVLPLAVGGLAWRASQILVMPAASSPPVQASLPEAEPLCLGAVLDSLRRLPVQRVGWRLQQANCAPAGRLWACRADYAAIDAQAMTAAFQAGLEAGWRVSTPGLDQIRLAWTAGGQCPSAVQADARRMPPDALWLRALQPWRQAFAELWMGPWAAASSDGKTAPMSRALRFKGPLRSFFLPEWPVLGVRWQRLMLQLDPEQAITLRHSPLTVLLEGALHAPSVDIP